MIKIQKQLFVICLTGTLSMSVGANAGSNKVLPETTNKYLKNPNVDISPIPNYRGSYVSLGGVGPWRVSETQKGPKSSQESKQALYASASAGSTKSSKAPQTTNIKAPKANCSTEAIVYYADRAPQNFQAEKRGLLYGVRTHTPATRVGNIPGYNSCALVVYAILKKAGCKWAKYTANAKKIYDMAYRKGWRPSKVQKPGCIVAWNSNESGWRARIGRGSHRKKGQSRGVSYRHVGITTGSWMAMDNTSIFSRPSAFITTRPIRYEPPLFLCPVAKKSKQVSTTKK